MQYINLIGLLSLLQLFAFGFALPKPRLGGYYANGAPHIAARDAAPEALTPTAAERKCIRRRCPSCVMLTKILSIVPVNRDLESKKKRAFEAAHRAAAPAPAYTVW